MLQAGAERPDQVAPLVDTGQKSARSSDWLQQRCKIQDLDRAVEIAHKRAFCEETKMPGDRPQLFHPNEKVFFRPPTFKTLNRENKFPLPPKKPLFCPFF